MSTPPSNPNRVRDHLANERTFLAWIRTAISLMGFGVVIVRLRYLVPSRVAGHGLGWELGLIFTVVGLVTVGLSTAHYFGVRRGIEAADYRPAGAGIVMLSLAVGLIGAAVLYWLLVSPAPSAVLPE